MADAGGGVFALLPQCVTSPTPCGRLARASRETCKHKLQERVLRHIRDAELPYGSRSSRLSLACPTSRRRDATATMISNVNTNNPAVKRIMREAREVRAATPATLCLGGCVHHAT